MGHLLRQRGGWGEAVVPIFIGTNVGWLFALLWALAAIAAWELPNIPLCAEIK